ncbi:MAG TPA: hypothetical protein VGJ93_09400 [Desulfuromonadaceae bacterium]|jgi:hypothetical protein
MNKNMLKICFIIALSLGAASAYAESTITNSVSMGGGSFSPSNKVTIRVDSNGTAYTAKSNHASGDRIVAANSADPKMWYKKVTIGTSEAAAIADVLSTAAWTSM